MTGNSKATIDKITWSTSSELNITCPGEPMTFLRIKIEHNQKGGTMKISQKNYRVSQKK